MKIFENLSMSDVTELTHLAFDFGPFFLALVFLGALSFKRNLAKIQVGLYSICMATCVAVSIGWWLYEHMRTPHAFQVTIHGLTENQKIGIEYPKQETIDVAPDGTFVYKSTVAVIRPGPFEIGEAIPLKFYQVAKPPPCPVAIVSPVQGVAPEELPVHYSGKVSEEFGIIWKANEKPTLTPWGSKTALQDRTQPTSSNRDSYASASASAYSGTFGAARLENQQ